MSIQPPLTADDLRSVSTFVDQIVARSLMASSSVEIETIRQLVRDYRAPQRTTTDRLGDLMRFKRYSRGAIVAYEFDAEGTIGLRHSDGRGLLRTSDGIPRSVIERVDIANVLAVLACVVEDLDQDACAARGVEVDP